MTFAEIEDLLGGPLPPSSHKHPAHWHSNLGSRPGRAIRDAGFRVSELDLVEDRVVLEPSGGDPFDDLIGVVFAEDFSIHLAARMPLAVVRQVAVWVPYVGAHQVRMSRVVLATPGVDDVADQLRTAANRWR